MRQAEWCIDLACCSSCAKAILLGCKEFMATEGSMRLEDMSTCGKGIWFGSENKTFFFPELACELCGVRDPHLPGCSGSSLLVERDHGRGGRGRGVGGMRTYCMGGHEEEVCEGGIRHSEQDVGSPCHLCWRRCACGTYPGMPSSVHRFYEDKQESSACP